MANIVNAAFLSKNLVYCFSIRNIKLMETHLVGSGFTFNPGKVLFRTFAKECINNYYLFSQANKMGCKIRTKEPTTSSD